MGIVTAQLQALYKHIKPFPQFCLYWWVFPCSPFHTSQFLKKKKKSVYLSVQKQRGRNFRNSEGSQASHWGSRSKLGRIKVFRNLRLPAYGWEKSPSYIYWHPGPALGLLGECWCTSKGHGHSLDSASEVQGPEAPYPKLWEISFVFFTPQTQLSVKCFSTGPGTVYLAGLKWIRWAWPNDKFQKEIRC